MLNSPVIIIECTAFGKSISEETAYERGHIHWNHLQPIVEKNKDKIFVLIHFSKRYKEQEIIDYFNKTGCSNIVVWLKNKVVQVNS